MDFPKMFQREIPLNEAASFYLRMTKQAEWTDPPDMTGQLEGTFLVPVEQVLAKLAVIITTKLRKMVAYHTYAESLNHPSWRGVKLEFHDHAEDEKDGADYYMKRATVLGGPVLFNAIEPPPPTTNLDTIMMTMARAEQESIAEQRELRQMVGDENPMKIGIEEQLLCDQHHLDELFQMMTPECRLALEQGGLDAPPAALEMGAPEAVPPEVEAVAEAPPSAEVKQAEARFEKAANKTLQRVGTAVQKGARRAGELLTGSRARSLAGKADKARDKVVSAVPKDHYGMALTPTAREKRDLLEQLPKLRRSATHARKYNDMAVQEFDRSTKVRGAVAGAGVLGVAGATGVAVKKEMDNDAAWMKEHNKTAACFEKAARSMLEQGGSALAGLGTGYSMGKSVAGQTAAALAPKGRVLRSEEIAEHAAVLGGPAGGIAALKYGLDPAMRAGQALGRSIGLPPIAAEIMVPMAVAALGSMAGGALTGAAVAGVQQLRGPVNNHKDVKTAAAALRFDLAVLKTASDLGTADPSMVSPSTGQTEPTNYLNAELAGRQAQEQNESAFYRQELAAKQQESQSMQQQLADMQMQLQSAQGQPDQAQQLMQQAVMAQDEATRQAMEAAKSRIGAQQLRAMVLEAVSQDPQQLGEAAFPQQMAVDPMTGQPPQVDPATGQPMAADPAAQAADPNAPAGPPAPAEPAPQVKAAGISHSALGAMGGAVIGAGSSYLAGRGADGLRGQVERLEGGQDGGFFSAARLAAAKAGLAHAELAQKHPVGAALKGALGGALTGAAAGGVIGQTGRSISELAR